MGYLYISLSNFLAELYSLPFPSYQHQALELARVAAQNTAISEHPRPSVWGNPVKGNHGNDRNRPWENPEGSAAWGVPGHGPRAGGRFMDLRRTNLGWVCRPLRAVSRLRLSHVGQQFLFRGWYLSTLAIENISHTEPSTQ